MLKCLNIPKHVARIIVQCVPEETGRFLGNFREFRDKCGHPIIDDGCPLILEYKLTGPMGELKLALNSSISA